MYVAVLENFLLRVGAFRKTLVSFGCSLNFGWLNAASYCSSDVLLTYLSDLVAGEGFISRGVLFLF